MVTVDDGAPVPASTGCGLAVRLSVADAPVSLAASCCRPMEAGGAGGAATSIVMVYVAVLALPLDSVYVKVTLPDWPALGVKVSVPSGFIVTVP